MNILLSIKLRKISYKGIARLKDTKNNDEAPQKENRISDDEDNTDCIILSILQGKYGNLISVILELIKVSFKKSIV